jgi:hypothetical protein
MVTRLQQKDLDENNKLSHFILAGADACKGERVQWFLACNKKALTKTTSYPILSLQARTPARAEITPHSPLSTTYASSKLKSLAKVS